ncbi:hypothetical protein BDP27DRAFT_1396917 [Rhodocollybia butyracea]|uniref:F-box domain-containing protein n=1 Tax=Rhodocollybia butyracea TaxID=206335 RepID=A0A9P5QCY0_9AGAR|nr:hypothetical protein BDP27DRAFT_1396917 [Rhodocollybia butyracea]
MTQGFTISYSPYTLPNAMPPAKSLTLPTELITGSSHAGAAPQMSPIFKLSPDILYHIFWDLSGGWVTLNPTSDLWVFTRVSRSLRLVGLSFASLWSRISLEPDDIRQHKHCAVDILLTVLDRSTESFLQTGHEGAHLRLRVYVDMLLVHANLLDILTAHYTRWYSLDLHISLFLLNTLSAQMAPLGFPLLSHLRLSIGSDQTNIPSIDVFSLCPALESVEFDSIPRCKALRLPWARLTRLVVKERVRSDFLRMLLSAPALQHAELVSILPSLHPEDPNDDPLPRSRIIEHKTLKSLVLKCIPFAVVLDSLYLPNLTELTIEHTAQASFGSLLGFIQRSNGGSQLKTLTMSGTLFLEEPEGALTRSMSASSLSSSLPPSPLSETGPAGSLFNPNLDQSDLTSSPPPFPTSATLIDVLNVASGLTTLVLEDWTPVQNPSPYDKFFLSISRSGDGGTCLLKNGVSLPGTPVISEMTATTGLSRSASLDGTFSPGFPGPFSSLPPAAAIPVHLQHVTSRSSLPGLPRHLANNPHIAAASAHLAAAGVQILSSAFTPLASNAGGAAMPELSTSNGSSAHIAASTQTQSPEPSEDGCTTAAVNAAHRALGIPPDHEEIMLPNLQTLTISNLSRNIIDLHLLAGMVESRWRGRVIDSSSHPRLMSTRAIRSMSAPSTPPPSSTSSPSIITAMSLHTDLRLIKNKGSVGRIKALQKETEEEAREGKGQRVKVYVSAKRWGGVQA